MKILLFSLLVFCLMICGCVQGSVDTISSNTVQSSQIYQIYYIEASKDRTDITAAFRVGGATGTTLELTEPGKISYNGAAIPMSAPSNLIGTNYRMKGTDYRTFSKNYNANHEFSFTDNDGKIFVNSVNLAPLEITGKTSISLDETQATTISLSRAVNTEEVLTIAVDSIIDEPISNSGLVYLNPNRSAVIITPQFWKSKNVKPNSEVILKIKKTGTVAQGTALGGSISAVYSAAPFYISVGKAKNNSANIKTKTAVSESINVNSNSAINSKPVGKE